jgi:hypothetical protein
MYHYAAKDNGMIYLAVGPGSEHREIAWADRKTKTREYYRAAI